MNHKNIKKRCFEILIRFKKKRIPFLPFFSVKKQTNGYFPKIQCFKVNNMKAIQFDHEESENRGPKVPWFILKASRPKTPK